MSLRKCDNCEQEHHLVVTLPKIVKDTIPGPHALEKLCADCIDSLVLRTLNQERTTLFRLLSENDYKVRLILEATNQTFRAVPVDFLCGCGKRFNSELARAYHIEASSLDEFHKHYPNGSVERGGYKPPLADISEEGKSENNLSRLRRRAGESRPSGTRGRKRLISSLARRSC